MRFTLLRAFVAAALLANLAYGAWHAGLLAVIGLDPQPERDPARLEQQVRPQALRVLPPAATAAALSGAASAAAVVGPPPPRSAEPLPEGASAPAPAAAASVPLGVAPPAPGSVAAQAAAAPAGAGLACLDIGPLDGPAAIDATERALSALMPERAWVREQRPSPAQYAVFVGPVMSRDAARQRREELVKLKMSFEAIELPDGKAGGKQGGYSLGRHDSEAAALAALDAFRERGLKAGRVVRVREAGAPRTWLRLERLSAAQEELVRNQPPAALGGQRATECSLGSVMSVNAPR